MHAGAIRSTTLDPGKNPQNAPLSTHATHINCTVAQGPPSAMTYIVESHADLSATRSCSGHSDADLLARLAGLETGTIPNVKGMRPWVCIAAYVSTDHATVQAPNLRVTLGRSWSNARSMPGHLHTWACAEVTVETPRPVSLIPIGQPLWRLACQRPSLTDMILGVELGVAFNVISRRCLLL